MGKDLVDAAFSPQDRSGYRQKVRRCLDVLAQLLDAGALDDGRSMTGLEIELNLMDARAQPAMRNAEILAGLGDPLFQAELGQFNLELNARPRLIAGDGFADYEYAIQEALGRAEHRAQAAGSTIVMIGSLPTLTSEHLVLANLSANERYRALNAELAGARGEQFSVDIRGVERLQTANDSIADEAACTSVQFHLQVAPSQFAAYWNSSQAVAAIQVAVGANSPYLHGRELWAETRIALFEQATDTRNAELKAQGVPPRVWFGERWISSVLDLFEENVHYFPPLLPVLDPEDPVAVLAAGGTPQLGELRLHNGTVYRWNRPVYDGSAGKPHLRVENRVLPSGPTVIDMLANAAFYFGLVRYLAEQEQPIWDKLPFAVAEDNFHVAARTGIAASVYWPGAGDVEVTELVLRSLLPKACAGLESYGVDPRHRDRLLGVIEGRCLGRRNGAVWQAETVARAGGSRAAALSTMLLRYAELQGANLPVHLWPEV
ncbi:MAG: hypothetical protein QOE51_219 [Actinoplanes sp.]|nr:hypothetical protein [Actinoplanes sp.]